MDEQPLAGGAALAGAEEAGAERRRRGGVEVGVVEHDERAVAAQLEQARLAGRRRRDLPPGRRRADEADRMRAGVAGELVADDRPRARDQVDHPRRQVGVGDALGERGRRRGGRDGRRPDDGVARCERRRDQLGRHRVRPVPRRDHGNDAARPADEQDALRGRHRARDPALQPLAVLGAGAPERGELVDLVVGLGEQRLALVERQHPGELVAAPLDGVGDPVQGGRALERARPGPARHSPSRRVDRRASVRAVALRDLADRRPARGRRRGEGLVRRRVDPGAADEHPHPAPLPQSPSSVRRRST